MDSSKNNITIYTDGACLGNPGQGGYAAVLRAGSHYRELSGGYRLTTNNRMELLAVIVALESIKRDGLAVILYSDSKYVVHAVIKGWLVKWRSTNFKDKKNVDLWKRFWPLYERYRPTFHWVKGHDGDVANERCDTLAVQAAKTGPWAVDAVYEKIIAK